MSTSQFCLQQRQKEQQRLTRLLIFGFASSAILHGILAYALPRWSFKSNLPNQVREPMELIIVDRPKPKPKQKVESKPIEKPKPEPKVESKPIEKPKPEPKIESKPIEKPKPEPVKAETPPTPVKPPKPVEEKTPSPKPAPKKVLTTPTPISTQPKIPVPAKKIAPSPISSNITAPTDSIASTETTKNKPSEASLPVATNSAPPRSEESKEGVEGISCISNCQPEYPSALEGIEGGAGVKLTIDRNGNVIGVELSAADSNSQVNRQALLAARQMKFSSPGDSSASVRVKIDFTVEGSQYDRARREEQKQRERAKKQEEIEAARQQQLEAERQARQEKLERERQARQQQQERQSQPKPSSVTQPIPKPLPPLSEKELDEERLRKFRERIENYQKQEN